MTVELKELRRELDPAAHYVRTKVKGKVAVKGSQLLVDAKARDVKLLLHKFLHKRRLEGYRVVASGADKLEVHGLRKPASKPAEKGNPPSPSITLPYYFPQGRGSVLFSPGRRAGRKP